MRNKDNRIPLFNSLIEPENLEELIEISKNCKNCDLYKERKQVVIGKGNIHSRILFVGQNPGAEEDKIGQPFVGLCGRILHECIDEIGLAIDEYYISNAVWCKTPFNRPPSTSEMNSCKWIFKLIKIMKPELIITVGKTATVQILKTEIAMKEAVKNVYELPEYTVIPVYHPSVVLRNVISEAEYRRVFRRIKEYK